jgi:dihydrolipoamide dehydrogenase
MADRKVRVAVIGAGSAGLSAYLEAKKVTDDIVLINGGDYGTTCARVGCMPSKVLLQTAHDYHHRHMFEAFGINGAEKLELDFPAVMSHVRGFRDRFVRGILKMVEKIGENNIEGYASFSGPDSLAVGDMAIKADRIVLAAGSRPFVPDTWNNPENEVLTSDSIFELTERPESLAVIGAGPVGLELGQAMARLGCKVTLIDSLTSVGGLTDPGVIDAAIKIFSEEIDIERGRVAEVSPTAGGINVAIGENSVKVERVLAAMGRKPNIETLGLENLGVPLNDRGLPESDYSTMQVGELPVFIAGDVNGDRPILHEAVDEGVIAGYNAVQENVHCFQRRVPLGIVFTEPNIAFVGKRYKDVQDIPLVIGQAEFASQGRALIAGKDKGVVRIYAESKRGTLLGAEMVAPAGEHFAHLLSLAIQHSLTVFEMLHMPFYHPVVEEILADALRDLASKVENPSRELELPPCDETLVK